MEKTILSFSLSEPVDCQIDLAKLPPDERLPGDPPSKAMIQSVVEYGVIEPVIVMRDGDGFRVVDGRTRIKAARAAGLVACPARVYESDWSFADVLALIANHVRRHNPRSDYLAICGLRKVLLDANPSISDKEIENEIARASGIPLGRVRNRLRLGGLISPLRVAFLDGKVPSGVAMAAAKCSVVVQNRLVPVFEEKGKLTAKDVAVAKAARRNESLPKELFDVAEVNDGEVQCDVHVNGAGVSFTFQGAGGTWSGSVPEKALFSLLAGSGFVFAEGSKGNNGHGY